MILKHLINPKPTIILFFIGFCLAFACAPLLLTDIQTLFLHTWMPTFLVFTLGLIITSFHALGLNNLIYEKNVIKKDNLVLGFVYVLLCTPFYNTVSAWFISFFLLFYINYLFESYQKDYPLSQIFNAAFILSILSFFYPNIILLIILIIITGINYDKVFMNDANSIVHWNCPDFFKETEGKFSAVMNDGCYEWVSRSIKKYGDFLSE